jgi:hypothetical protein
VVLQVLEWADAIRTMSVKANADTPEDARKGRELGAEGIGLCRTVREKRLIRRTRGDIGVCEGCFVSSAVIASDSAARCVKRLIRRTRGGGGAVIRGPRPGSSGTQRSLPVSRRAARFSVVLVRTLCAAFCP